MAARRGLLAATLLAAASAASQEAQAARGAQGVARAAADVAERSYQLPAQPLGQALRAVALTAGIDTLFAPDLMAGRQSAPVIGRMDAERALAAAISGQADLEAVRTGPRAFLVRRRPGAAPPLPRNDGPRLVEPPLELAEVMITAFKRPALLQGAAASISALTGPRLEDLGVEGLDDLKRLAPGLNLTENGPGQRRLTIRGVQSSGENTVGLYFGETPVAGPSTATSDVSQMSPDLALVDMERVEVLRGPQGTLYGAGSISGTLRLLFNPPDPNEGYGRVRGRVWSARGGSGATGLQAVGNLPFAGGRGAIRGVVYDLATPGQVDNVALGLSDVDESRTRGWRLQAMFAPREDVELTAIALSQRQRVDDASFWFQHLGVGVTDNAVRLPFPNDFDLYGATLRASLGGAGLTVTSARYSWDTVRYIDSNRPTTAVIAPATWCPLYAEVASCDAAQKEAYRAYVRGVLPVVGRQPARVDAWTHEARLTSSGDGPLSWTLGAFLESREDHSESGTFQADPATGEPYTPARQVFLRTIAVETGQTALFGEARLAFSPGWALTLGGRRYAYDKASVARVIQTGYLNGSAAGPPVSQSAEARGWVGRANLAWQASPTTLAWVQLSEGFRPGGVNTVPNLPADLVAFRPDQVTSFEAGIKHRLFDGRLLINAAAYRIDWFDMQVRRRIPSFTFVSNGGASRILGLEAEVEAVPAAGLRLRAAAGYAHSRLIKDQAQGMADVPGREGDHLPFEPSLTGSASLDYRRRVSDGLAASFGLSAAYTGTAGSQYRTDSIYYEQMGGFWVADLSVGLHGADWSVIGQVRNALSAVGRFKVESDIGLERMTLSAEPRTLSLSLSRRF
ncbi:TonB-dependent receptor [Caulobacter segnis]|uniref:TonB-dependent receptor domain-containing protein n=1 Tax=Caulobacter segnis TaxID=88688 RepID=UPI00241082C0|nr:TonB-dependent receptor [Caulobacter segnis]MDG2520668.1 TonB-dependent receptor [Caulobacter segnis]